jgi:hypothetical protein
MSPLPTLARISSIVSQLSCRHSYMRRAGFGRMWLECSECHHETRGVQVTAPEARSRRIVDDVGMRAAYQPMSQTVAAS